MGVPLLILKMPQLVGPQDRDIAGLQRVSAVLHKTGAPAPEQYSDREIFVCIVLRPGHREFPGAVVIDLEEFSAKRDPGHESAS